MKFNASDFLARLWALDAVLVDAGFPPVSPWWRSQLERFFRCGRRTFVLRVGRRGGKSSTLCRVAVAWALYGTWHVPPGDVGVVAFVSVHRDESGQRLRTIEAILKALGVDYRRSGDTIELQDRSVLFKTFTASISGVSGPTCIAAIGDEVCKWKDADTGANPGREVISSLRPTMATQPRAPLFLCSSPLSTQDAHYRLFERGDTPGQLTACAETWIANPTITEAQTREDEPDPRIWAREYAATPQPAVGAAFDAEAIERAFEPSDESDTRGRRIIVLDPSSGRKDSWTWSVVGWDEFEGVRVLTFDLVDGQSGRFFDQVRADAIVGRVARLATDRGITSVHADQREAFALQALFAAQNLDYIVHDWTAASKPAAVERLRRWFADDRVALPEHAKLKSELLAFEERVTPSGQFTFGARGSGHDDYVALLLTAVMAIGDEADIHHVDLSMFEPAGGGNTFRREADDFWGFGHARGGSRWDGCMGKGF